MSDNFGDDILDLRDIALEAGRIWAQDNILDHEWDYLRLAKDLAYEMDADLDDPGANDPTLINEDYFTEYAKELADELGAVDANAGWPNDYIDWEAAADALKMDYTEYNVGTYTYYGRG